MSHMIKFTLLVVLLEESLVACRAPATSAPTASHHILWYLYQISKEVWHA